MSSTFASVSNAYNSFGGSNFLGNNYDPIDNNTVVIGNQTRIARENSVPNQNTKIIYLSNHDDWQYGTSMSPPVTYYDVAEMPTAGLRWTNPPNGAEYAFWVSASTSGNGPFVHPWFLQDGFIYNGLSQWICINSCFGNNVPPHSWGLFYTYTDSNGNYFGTGIPIPSGWSPSDHIYFSLAIYRCSFPCSHITDALEFLIDDHTVGSSTLTSVCISNNPRNGDTPPSILTGGVGGIAEDPTNHNSGYGNIYVDQLTLWAENIAGNIRYSNNVYAYDSGSPTSILTYTYSSPWGNFQVGFNGMGSHITSGTLFSGSYTLGLEDVPPNNCP